jgi:hypothetical protein
MLPLYRSPVGTASAPANAWEDPDKEDRYVCLCVCAFGSKNQIIPDLAHTPIYLSTNPHNEDARTHTHTHTHTHTRRLQGVLDRLNAEADLNLFGFGGLNEEKPAFAHLAHDVDDTVCLCVCVFMCVRVCMCVCMCKKPAFAHLAQDADDMVGAYPHERMQTHTHTHTYT